MSLFGEIILLLLVFAVGMEIERIRKAIERIADK